MYSKNHIFSAFIVLLMKFRCVCKAMPLYTKTNFSWKSTIFSFFEWFSAVFMGFQAFSAPKTTFFTPIFLWKSPVISGWFWYHVKLYNFTKSAQNSDFDKSYFCWYIRVSKISYVISMHFVKFMSFTKCIIFSLLVMVRFWYIFPSVF